MGGWDIMGQRGHGLPPTAIARGYASLGIAVQQARKAFENDLSLKGVWVQRPGDREPKSMFTRDAA